MKLLRNSAPNDFREIMKTTDTLDELLTATYARALEKDCLDDYRFKRMPYPPHGWAQDHAAYKTVSDEKKSAAWKKIAEYYSGYLKARDEIYVSNRGNQVFLEQMLEHFKKIGLKTHEAKVNTLLAEFN